MITRQQIRHFLAVTEAGSFTQAAESIGVTQPTLSSGIRELEDRVGAKLFERRRPAVRLTSAGNRLLPIARRIEREFRRAELETAQASSARQSFVLGVIPSIGTALLESALATQALGTLVVREKDEPTLHRELRRGTIDAALTFRREAGDASVRPIDLWSDRYRLMLPATHRLADRELIEAEELADDVMIARRSCEMLGYTSKFFTDRGVRPEFAFKSRNDDRAMALVAAGLGVTVAPHSLVRDGVVSVELAGFEQSRRLALLVRADDFEHSSRYRGRVDGLVAVFRDASRELHLPE